ncbi:PEP/pyruvate-binding domain-containing protein [Candidatus Leptofilum sp.]|uniref:PEP/pyruvate-binding domain-containing protein n=1 Tax=Candidatus Leptofilum sp. TaxID=3241576 RepID=UPI003B5CC0BB
MPTGPLRTITPTIDIYIKLAQYPILCDRIRLRMREELFRRGIVNKIDFEQEVKELAIESQRREGLDNPTVQEDEGAWQRRLETIRDLHTDNYFANNLGITLLEQLIGEVLNNQDKNSKTIELTFNPEIAPWAMLFEQGEIYDALPPPEKEKVKHHLEEIKVVLIKRLLSDQLPFIRVAKKVFTIKDLNWIYERLIGSGKIGGKSGGMLLAWHILERANHDLGPDLSKHVTIPDTYFIGSEIIYEFMLHNKMERFVNQKYLSVEEMREQYPEIVHSCKVGKIPNYIMEQLRDVLAQLNGRPFVVRSSSLLEDHLDYQFAGKYDSVFCPNQGSHQENFKALLDAVRRVYASTFNPDAMLERQKHGLIDYDERMAVMIQALIGHKYGRYYLPTIVGAGLSQNPWYDAGDSRAKDGCLRLTLGLDKRVQRPLEDGNACIISLNTPDYMHDSKNLIQDKVKVVDLEDNCFKVLPISDILQADYPNGRYLLDPETNQLTYDYLINDAKFIRLMRTALKRLAKTYGVPVQFEFAIEIVDAPSGTDYKLYILQCHTAQ